MLIQWQIKLPGYTELLESFFLALISGGITLIQCLSSGEVTIMNINFKGVIWKFRLSLIFEEKVRPVVKKTHLGNVETKMTMCLLIFYKINILHSWLTRSPSDVRDPSVPVPLRTGTLKLSLFSRWIFWSGLKSNVEQISSGLCNHSFFDRVDGCLSVMVQEK